MSDLISKQVLELWNRYKPTIAVDAIEYDRELKKLLGTNLAEVGTEAITKQQAIDEGMSYINGDCFCDKEDFAKYIEFIEQLPPIQPEIVRCKDCKHNPKYEWFGCPMSHLSEKQRPETAWCWKAERRTDE